MEYSIDLVNVKREVADGQPKSKIIQLLSSLAL